LPGFSAYRLSKPHAGAPTVFVDEFDAGPLQGSPHDIKRRTSWLAAFLLKLMDRHNPNLRPIGQRLLTPTK
jgi:hypothetical protein